MQDLEGCVHPKVTPCQIFPEKGICWRAEGRTQGIGAVGVCERIKSERCRAVLDYSKLCRFNLAAITRFEKRRGWGLCPRVCYSIRVRPNTTCLLLQVGLLVAARWQARVVARPGLATTLATATTPASAATATATRAAAAAS